jgi:hypothetical protein
MPIVLIVISIALAVALGAHVALVLLTFRSGARRGVAALVLPPFAWVAPFLSPARPRQRAWAGLALACLFGSMGFSFDTLHALNHGLSVAGTSVGDPPNTARHP